MEENKLDVKTLVALGVMTLMMIWMFFNTPEPQSKVQPTQKTEKKEIVSNKKTSNSVTFGKKSVSKEIFSEISNGLLTLKISNKGGQIAEVLVNSQKTYKGEPVYLIKDKNAHFGVEFFTNDSRLFNTKHLFFEPIVSKNKIIMRLEIAENQFLEYIYSLRKDEYMVDFSMRSKGLSSLVNTSKAVTLSWKMATRRMEKSVTYEDRYTQLMAQHDEERLQKLSETSNDGKQVQNVLWVNFKQHLFSNFLISETPFKNAKLSSAKLVSEEKETQQTTKSFYFSAPLQLSSGEINQKLHWYFGPSEYSILKKYDQYNLKSSIPLGWGIFGWINKGFVIPVFNFLNHYMSVGIAIIVLTIIVKILLSPIQYKAYVSQAKMKVLRPEIEEINAKFKEPMKRQQETMALYSKAGVSPMSGCIPALLQMPVFFALFSFFPAAFLLRQKGFLWAEDLASYDSVMQLPFNIPFYGSHISLFPILASIAIFIYMTMTTGQMQQPQQEGMPNMKFMMYLSPIMMLFFFNNYASGLSLYYFISNLITIFIMLAIKYWIIDENKIHAQIQENKQKPKKESKWQRKMREMMEQAQEQQKNRR